MITLDTLTASTVATYTQMGNDFADKIEADGIESLLPSDAAMIPDILRTQSQIIKVMEELDTNRLKALEDLLPH